MASPVFKSEVAGLNSVIMKILMEIVEREWHFRALWHGARYFHLKLGMFSFQEGLGNFVANRKLGIASKYLFQMLLLWTFTSSGSDQMEFLDMKRLLWYLVTNHSLFPSHQLFGHKVDAFCCIALGMGDTIAWPLLSSVPCQISYVTLRPRFWMQNFRNSPWIWPYI